ncbi:hypothetical protein ACTA71_003366 [Dictyostelium dimigraforme]
MNKPILSINQFFQYHVIYNINPFHYSCEVGVSIDYNTCWHQVSINIFVVIIKLQFIRVCYKVRNFLKVVPLNFESSVRFVTVHVTVADFNVAKDWYPQEHSLN